MGFTAAGNFFAYSFLFGVTLLVFHSDRKLLAYSFLLGVAPLWFIATGNFLHTVSCPALTRLYFMSPSCRRKLASCRGGSVSLY